MADEKEVIIKIKSEYDSKGNVDAEKGLEKVEKKAKDVGAASKQAGQQGALSMDGFAKGITKVLGSIAAIKGVIDFFTSSISAANENARAVNTLAAAYQAVGYTANGAMEQAQQFATKMQNLTGIADEAFLNAQRLLANYGVVGSKAQEAIQAAYSLSIGKNIEFASAMDLVAKAAAGQTSALSRYGITLGDNVKEGEKFEATLGKINELFGATAQAAMGDTITKTNALKQAWGDFKEQVGAGLNEGLAPVLEWLTTAMGWLNTGFKKAGVIASWFFDSIMVGIQMAKAGLALLGEAALNAIEPAVKVASYLPKIGNKIQAAFDDAKNGLNKMKEGALAQADAMSSMATPLSDVLKEEKKITEENKEALKINEQIVNSKRAEAAATKEVAKATKKSREEQQKILDNMGLSSSKDLKGWKQAEQNTEPAPTNLEIAAGGESPLATAEDNLTKYQNESAALEQLMNEKRAYIEQEITDEKLKQEALTNLQTQYNEQVLANDRNQAKARQQIYGSMWSALTNLANSSNKKVAAIGKIASIAQATMSMFTGAAKALELPFPANLAAVATVLAQGAMLVEQIKSVKLAKGGLVKAVTGGVNAVIGEGGSDEAVLPLDNSRAMQRIGTAISDAGGAVKQVIINQYINITAGTGIINDITEALRSGTVDALEFANLNYQIGQQQQGYSV